MDIHKEIEKYKAMGANLLIPFTKLEPSEFHTPVIDETHLDIDAGDAYPQGKKNIGGQWVQMYALSFQGLSKLAVCANVQWHPYETKRTDNRSDRLYVSFQAVAGIRKSDGAVVPLVAHYDMDFEVIEEELFDQYRDKLEKDNQKKNWPDQQKQDFVANQVRRDMIFKRKHRLKLAESGAKARVLRSLLGVKKVYTPEELQKPFVVVRYVFRMDTKDPGVRRQLIQASMNSMSAAYGPMALPAPSSPEVYDDAMDLTQMKQCGPEPEEPEVEGETPEDDFPETEDEGLDDEMWQAASFGEKCLEIERLAETTGYDLRGFERKAGYKINKLPDGKMNSLRKNLIELQGGKN